MSSSGYGENTQLNLHECYEANRVLNKYMCSYFIFLLEGAYDLLYYIYRDVFQEMGIERQLKKVKIPGLSALAMLSLPA